MQGHTNLAYCSFTFIFFYDNQVRTHLQRRYMPYRRHTLCLRHVHIIRSTLQQRRQQNSRHVRSFLFLD